MAKNWFKHSESGYREVMQGADVMQVCEAQAHNIAASASGMSGIDYAIDSVKGLNRIHTRVSTVTKTDFFRERSYRALQIACGLAGGNVTGRK